MASSEEKFGSRERKILVNHYTQPKGRGPQTETRSFPISPNTRYKKLLRQVRKAFELKEGFDLAYPKLCRQNNIPNDQRRIIKLVRISGDHDIVDIFKQQQQDDEEDTLALQLDIMLSSNIKGLNAFERGWLKSKDFMRRHRSDFLEILRFYNDYIHPAVLKIANDLNEHQRQQQQQRRYPCQPHYNL